ncbi:MAG TPA: DUF5693 family protein [Candidatus Baltobacteraceae bacterium]|nr:DUF5693 family protein [Candidatus Baltobacteraceae bacterium]
MNRIDPRTRFAAFLLLIALLSCAFVALSRATKERQTNRVEIAMDYNDFLSFARSYNYNPAAFLIELRRAGLTSLALTEELGNSLTGATSSHATAISGLGLLSAARLSPVSDPTLASLVRRQRVRPGSIYLVIYDRPTFERYMQQLPLHFERNSITVLNASVPYVIALRTQIDYFNTTSLGIPAEQVQLARKVGFFVIPRFQNDERLQDGQIPLMFDDLHAGKWISTVVFFGLRNQVLGFPDHLNDTAQVFKTRKYTNYGEIETYDTSQEQKGNLELARLIPGHVVRVQAISKLELDKLTVPQIVARYELGVRERNVRVVYLRPFPHQYGKLSIEKTNVEIVRQIADDLRGHGFRLGRATPIPLYRGNSAIAVGVAVLAVPSLFVLLLGWLGWYRPSFAALAYLVAIGIYVGGYASHHDLLGRSIVALIGALLFATAAFMALAPAFSQEPAPSTNAQIVRSLGWTLVATGVALLGALVVVGIMSSPLTMEEVEPFRGVKLVLALPPIVALALYLFTDRYDSGIRSAREAFAAPIRIYQLLLACVVIGAGVLVLMRSGNQSDIAPSGFELSLRHHLTALLSVRPRFKEFLVGFPFMMLLPALRRTDRRAAGIIFSLGIGVGIGDVIDTFSHLHTPLLISIVRVIYGLVIGAIIGSIAIAVYRRLDARRTPSDLVPPGVPGELIEA